jgi:hypothetical protein
VAGYRVINSNAYFWHLIEKECAHC